MWKIDKYRTHWNFEYFECIKFKILLKHTLSTKNIDNSSDFYDSSWTFIFIIETLLRNETENEHLMRLALPSVHWNVPNEVLEILVKTNRKLIIQLLIWIW